MTQPMIESIGLVAGATGLIAWVPQLQTVWIKREHRGVNRGTLIIIFTALCMWCVYGVLREAWAVCASNACSGMLVATIFARVTWLRAQAPATDPDSQQYERHIVSTDSWEV